MSITSLAAQFASILPIGSSSDMLSSTKELVLQLAPPSPVEKSEKNLATTSVSKTDNKNYKGALIQMDTLDSESNSQLDKRVTLITIERENANNITEYKQTQDLMAPMYVSKNNVEQIEVNQCTHNMETDSKNIAPINEQSTNESDQIQKAKTEETETPMLDTNQTIGNVQDTAAINQSFFVSYDYNFSAGEF